LTSINDKGNVLGVINNIKSSYDIEAYVLDKNGDSIIGESINVNIKREKDVDYKSNIVIKVDNGFNRSKGITVSEMSLNNKYFGELVLVKDFTDEYVNTIFTLIGIVFSQIVVIGILLKLISNYIRKSLEPLSVLKEGIVKYGKGEDVINLNIKSSDEIEDLSVSFINMAEEVNNEKRKSVEFFNNATHELKTPITAISGYVQALTKKPIEEINLDFRNRAFYRMKIESSKLLALVENLLDISRGAVKKEILIEEINVLNITKECIKSLELRAINNNFIIEETEVTIKANRDDVTTIIYNLIDNAIKYSKSRDIKIYIGEFNTIFKIENEIYEIPEDKKNKLLEPFIKYDYKLDENREEKISSSGLGLYLCESLAQSNNLNLSYSIKGDSIEVLLKLIDNK
ncbi:MAG: histidine kinase dimerization/phospho-acceptor domain-containing protein, partial [Clostridium sp.]